MSEAKHTPGPWEEYPQQIVDQITRQPEPLNKTYRSIRSGRGYYGINDVGAPLGFELTGYISPADARLIAAAPELLKELLECQKELLGASAYLETCDPLTILANLDSFTASLKRRLTGVEAVIRKAEGR